MLIDISRPIHPKMSIYPGNPDVLLESVQEASREQSGLTQIRLGSHTGTHVDARSHITAGESGIEAFTLDQYIGSVDVVEIARDKTIISVDDIPPLASKRVIFRTANSDYPVDEFRADFRALDETAAKELVRRNVVLVGIDALSIKKKGVRDRVHEMLLQANIVILEGLYMPDVQPGRYTLICLPLSIPGIDGVPARAILAPLTEAN